MNPVQVADLIEQIPQNLTPNEFLVALATKAAEVEREMCAKVCEDYAKQIAIALNESPVLHCAAAIRARGEK